ncbi:hypothetical protein V1514DRAFT_336446 [Lipomyces japonicus]|uniref:uncharacterized protein n=1 Tax=Lipomyces japonicus TaxID=56871 RepID=UPI0034CF55DE
MAFLFRSRAGSDPGWAPTRDLPALPFYRTLSAPALPPYHHHHHPDRDRDGNTFGDDHDHDHDDDHDRLQLPLPRFPVTPRDEEGRESLPPYSPAIVRTAVFARKLEMVTPLDVASVRSWTTVDVVLNNTQLNIYKQSSLSASSSLSSPSSSHAPPPLSQRRLIKSYTLQYAQVGLATDYKKKPNVIRVRAEGHQFLLACADAHECVDWTIALQAACDLALPLDDRAIPRYRSIPSRRRTRRILPSARTTTTRRSSRDHDYAVLEVHVAQPEVDPALPAAHESDEDDLYYRNAAAQNHDDNDNDNDNDTTTNDNTNATATATATAHNSPAFRRISAMPADASEPADQKWAPQIHQSSTSSALRYAIRCLYSLPANSSWGDKLLLSSGDTFIVRHRVQAN